MLTSVAAILHQSAEQSLFKTPMLRAGFLATPCLMIDGEPPPEPKPLPQCVVGLIPTPAPTPRAFPPDLTP